MDLLTVDTSKCLHCGICVECCPSCILTMGENGPECRIILDREQAITTALKEAKRGDVIALVARGEESRRWWKGEILECVSDVELARRYCEGTL